MSTNSQIDDLARMDIRQADLLQTGDQQAVLNLIDQYAQNLMGGGKPLRPDVRQRLIAGLRDHPSTLIFLALIDGQPVGIATCFVGFSTFEARPLVNIHDLAVIPQRQGQGIGKQLIETVMQYCKSRDYCAVTLEVRMDNAPARKLYDRMGFQHLGKVLGDDTMLFGKLKFPPVVLGSSDK